jgi:glutamate-ammonia-ligase adenylyltransferase
MLLLLQNLLEWHDSQNIDDPEFPDLLKSAGFVDTDAAMRSFLRLVNIPEIGESLKTLLPKILLAFSNSANPDKALINLEHFINHAIDRPTLLRLLAKEPRNLEILNSIFSGSQFLTNILLRYPEYFDLILNRKQLARPKNPDQFKAEARAAVMHFREPAQKLDALRRFHKWELLRIGASDLLGLLDLQGVTGQLSHLADTLIQFCLTIASQHLGVSVDKFAVLALGKLGGLELNYSSDIDLIFISKDKDPKFLKLGQRLIEALTSSTEEGFLYRVDMRLRPWGDSGALVPDLQENINYIINHSRLWEKQALLKARVVGGDEQLGMDFLHEINPIILEISPHKLQNAVRSMKQQIEINLKKRGKKWGEIKGGEGSIRDIEFITQYLQLTNGKDHPEILSRSTLDALARLSMAEILPEQDFRTLSEGYRFLRSVEHHLQIMHYQQTHHLPKDERQLNYLAGRLGFEGKDVGRQLINRFKQHSKAIRQCYSFYLEQEEKLPEPKSSSESRLKKEIKSAHLIRLDSSYSNTFNQNEILKHSEMASKISENNILEMDLLSIERNKWIVTIVGFDYVGELSVICGLLFSYGFDIIEGHIFTYEPEFGDNINTCSVNFSSKKEKYRRKKTGTLHRKIVDTFTVRSVKEQFSENIWNEYREDLALFIKKLRKNKQDEVQGELAKKVAKALNHFSSTSEILLPVEIEIDNISSNKYTILRIDAPDTIGFLYEMTNALLIYGVNISRVTVSSVGNRVHDTLFVTDLFGKKIIEPEKQRELKATTVLVKHFTHLLPNSPNPELAILNFRQLVAQLFTKENWSENLASLDTPEVLDALAKLLGYSDFLWDDFLRMQYENLFPVVSNINLLRQKKSKKTLLKELNNKFKKSDSYESKKIKLNTYKDVEIFRIDMRYIQGLVKHYPHFSEELSDLAEAIIETVINLSFQKLINQFGKPILSNGNNCRFAVCAMGKFGGREIGFASDLELLFVYEGKGFTPDNEKISNSDFFNKLVQELLHIIMPKRQGIFEIDLRLRPYGKAGNLAVPINLIHEYFSPEGPAWEYERQSLVKLRPFYGELKFQEQIEKLRNSLVYTQTPLKVREVRAMRERQIRQLVAGGTLNVKYSPGGLVDLEYLIQILQITFGHSRPKLRETNTIKALIQLKDENIISEENYKDLHEAYIFLIKLIESLRIVRGNAKDLTVPNPDSEQFYFLARRLEYRENTDALQNDIFKYTTLVSKLSQKIEQISVNNF